MNILKNILSLMGLPALSENREAGLSIVLMIICLILCYFGYQTVNLFTAVVAFLAGSAAGYVISAQAAEGRFELTGLIRIGISLAAGLLFALLCHFVYRLGIFIYIFAVAMSASYELIVRIDGMTERNLEKAVAILIGITAALLTMRFLRTMIIIITAVGGGFSFTGALFQLITVTDENNRTLFILITGALIAAGGVMYQLRHTKQRTVRRKKKR